MNGPWSIKTPPPVFPVRPGDSIRDRQPPPKRPRKDDEAGEDETQDKRRDDDGRHIDEYA